MYDGLEAHGGRQGIRRLLFWDDPMIQEGSDAVSFRNAMSGYFYAHVPGGEKHLRENPERENMFRVRSSFGGWVQHSFWFNAWRQRAC